MINELITTLERLNKLPLTSEERAELMRAVIDESRRDGAIQRRPGPKNNGGPSVASRVLETIRNIVARIATEQPYSYVGQAARDILARIAA